jgi:hypothetical protein
MLDRDEPGVLGDGEDYSACYYDDFRGRHAACFRVLDSSVLQGLMLLVY